MPRLAIRASACALFQLAFLRAPVSHAGAAGAPAPLLALLAAPVRTLRAIVCIVCIVCAVVVVASASACMIDAKDQVCTFDAMMVSGENLYCPDAEAPADCEALNDAVITAGVRCGDGAFTEDEMRAALDEDGALQQCDEAQATSLDYESCLAFFANATTPPCDGLAIAPLPDVCVGVILTKAAA